MPRQKPEKQARKKSAKRKRLRQNAERRLRNRSRKSALRTQLRKVREALKAGDVARAETEARLAQKKLDQAGARRVIHPNKAARLKSRMQAAIRRAKSTAAAAG